MKHSLICILSLFFLLSSCLDEASRAGGKWVDSSLRNIFTDTCTVTLSTILADSVSTSGDSIFQIGNYSDNIRGAIHSSFFAEYSITKPGFSEEDYYQLDSVTLSIWPSGDYLGDTLTTQTLHLHRLLKTIELHDDNYLYNTSSVPFEETPFHSFSFRFYPNRKEEIRTRLPLEFGEEFFDLMLRNSSIVDSQDHFRQYFPGLHVRPDELNSCISGLAVNDSSMCITLHYQKIEETSIELTTTLKPTSSYWFTQASQERQGTPFEKVQTGTHNALHSGESGNMAYLQGMTGLYIKIEFPHLNNLMEAGEMVSIERAALYFYPVEESYSKQTPLPQDLTLYTANEENEAEGVITDSSGNSVQTGNLQEEEMVKDGTYYTFDITSFLQSNLGTIGMNRQKLMLMLPNEKFVTTVGGLILGDMNHTQNNVKLEILYKAYNSQPE